MTHVPRPRLAVLVPWCPIPDNVGHRLRFCRLTEQLATRADLSLFVTCWSDEAEMISSSPWVRHVFRECRVYAVDRAKDAPSTWIPFFAGLRDCVPSMARKIAALNADNPFSAIVTAHGYTALTARRLKIPIVVDEHNIDSRGLAESLGDAEAAEHERVAPNVAAQLQYERMAWESADLVISVAEYEAAHIRKSRTGPVEVVPNGADVAKIDYVSPLERTRKDVLFVGNMSHVPNAQGARFLAERVMPKVRERIPDARLVICGATPSEEVRSLGSSWCEVTGTVPSVFPYLSSAALFANALFHGAGSSLKVPEALAAGLPVVSTRVGVRGFELQPGVHYTAAETEEEFVEGISSVLTEPQRFVPLADAARRHVEPFDWQRLGARYAEIICAVERRPHVSAPEGHP